GVFVGEKGAMGVFRGKATLLQPQHDLARAETPVNEKLAVIRCNQRAVPRAPAAEHGQAEHGSQDSRVISACANRNRQITRLVYSILWSRSILGMVELATGPRRDGEGFCA